MNSFYTSVSSKAVAAFFFLFGMPFAAFGLWAFSQAFHLIGAPPESQSFWYPFMFGTIFSGIGFGLMYLAVTGSRKCAHQLNIQALHPGEPWLWRDDWAAGRVKSNTKTNMVISWIFAAFWNLISWTIAIFALPDTIKQKGSNAYFMLIFPAIGIFILIYAIRETIEFFEFGKTCFEMASVPAAVGRELKGSIQTRFAHSPDHGVRLRLSCVHRYVSGSGNNASTNEQILWRDEVELNPGQLCVGPVGTTIPVSFHIPREAQPTEKLNARDEFLWQLEANASVPGVNYHEVFEVPVFRTAQSPTQSEAEEDVGAPAFGIQDAKLSRPEQRTIRVQPVAAGTEFYFPAARNKGFALSSTVFAVVFGNIGYFLRYTNAPFIFPFCFGGFGLLIGYIALKMWLGTTRVVIGPSLTLQSGWLGGGKTRQIALSEIASITDKITAQQGGSTGTPYYDIELMLRDGKKLTLGRTLRNKHETEWLVGEMRRLIDVKEKTMTAGAQ